MVLLVLTIILFVGLLIAMVFTALHWRGEYEHHHVYRYERRRPIDGQVVESISKEEYDRLNSYDKMDYKPVKTDEKITTWSGKGWKAFWLLLIPPASLLLLLFGIFTTVGANEVGIIYDQLNGGVLEETYDQGLHIKSIFRKVTKISTTNRTAFIEVNSQTEDSIYATFEITIIYKIEKGNAGLFYRTTGKVDIAPEDLNSIIKKNLQSVTTQYDIFDIMGLSLEEVRSEFRDALSEDLENIYHITLVSVSIDDVDAGADIEKIIQDKAKAIQEIEIEQQNKLKQAVINETNKIKAQTDAEIALIKAQSDYDVAEKKAEAQSVLNAVAVTAIQTMYESQFNGDQDAKDDFELNDVGGYLTIQEIGDIVIKQLYYDVWDGKLPTVISDGSGIIIQP